MDVTGTESQSVPSLFIAIIILHSEQNQDLHQRNFQFTWLTKKNR
jgi:hypothetical protein